MRVTFNREIRPAVSLFLAVLAASSLAANSLAQELPPRWQDRIKLGVRSYERGEHRLAFDIFAQLQSEGLRKFGDSDGRMARLYTNLGEIYSEMGELPYAEQYLKRGLRLAQSGYGDNSLQSVPGLVNLAQLYVKLGRDAQAQPLLKQALSIVDKPGDDRLVPYVVVIETNLGSMFFEQGNYALAEPRFRRALDVATRSLGAGHKWTITVGGMYAACLHALGRLQEARAIEQSALSKAAETQSPIAVWNREIGLADAAIDAKRFVEAEEALQVALKASRELTAEPMIEAVTLIRTGQLMLLQDKPDIAIEKWQSAQALAESVLGLDDDAVLKRAKRLADLLKAQAQYSDAEPLYSRLVVNAKKQAGPDSEEYASALADLADLYSKWAHYPQAVRYYSKLLEWQENKFGPTSEKLVPTLVSLGIAVQNNTQYFSKPNVKAEEHLKRAEQIATRHFGKYSRELAQVLDALGHYYQRHCAWEQAVKACTQMVAATEKNFGPQSPETIKALERYAVLLRAAGLRRQAEPVEERIAKTKGHKDELDD